MTNQKGFTLIELLVVIAIIGVLSGVLVNVIDGQQQKRIAEDATKRTNLEKMCSTLKSYYQGEGAYPHEGDVNNPLDSSAPTSDVASIYLTTWPTDFIYDEDGSGFSVYVQKSTDTHFFKCGTAWRTIQECNATTATNNVSACDALP